MFGTWHRTICLKNAIDDACEGIELVVDEQPGLRHFTIWRPVDISKAQELAAEMWEKIND